MIKIYSNINKLLGFTVCSGMIGEIPRGVEHVTKKKEEADRG